MDKPWIRRGYRYRKSVAKFAAPPLVARERQILTLRAAFHRNPYLTYDFRAPTPPGDPNPYLTRRFSSKSLPYAPFLPTHFSKIARILTLRVHVRSTAQSLESEIEHFTPRCMDGQVTKKLQNPYSKILCTRRESVSGAHSLS